MRVGWSCKEAAAVLGINERRVTQSLDPTLQRMALLWRADASRTMAALLDAVERLDPMSNKELRMREMMLEGRLDSRQLRQAR